MIRPAEPGDDSEVLVADAEDANRFYEREQPSGRSTCFGWEL